MKNKRENLVFSGLHYWLTGGFIWGLSELLLNMVLHSWVLPKIKEFRYGLLLYPALFVAVGLLFNVGRSLYHKIVWRREKNINSLSASILLALIFFVWSAVWGENFFAVAKNLQTAYPIIFFHYSGLLFLAFLIGSGFYRLFSCQEKRGLLFITFIAVACGLFAFLIISGYLYVYLLPGFLYGISLKYNLITLANCIFWPLVLYFIFRFLIRFNWLIRLGGAVLLLAGVISLAVYAVKPLQMAKARKEPKNSLRILNKATLIRQKKPNVLLISIDALRADHLSCYGNTEIKTPIIDSLATSGVLFKNDVSVAPWTASSMASMLTGVYPSVHGVKKNNFSNPTAAGERVVWLAQVLREIGYETGAITNNIFIKADYGFDRGFDNFYSLEGGLISRQELDKARVKEEFLEDKQLAFLWFNFIKPTHLVEPANANGTSIITQKTLECLNKKREKPFFLWVHYLDPHDPYERHKTYGLNKTYKGVLRDDNIVRTLQRQEIHNGIYQFSRADQEYFHSLYEEEILWVEENLAQVLSNLREKKLLENTLVILTSDHGEEFWEHGSFAHGHTLYNELLHVPLIICFPKIFPAGTVINQQVSSIDIMPTILDLLRVEHNLPLQGKSLLPLINNQEIDERLVFSEGLLFFEERKALQNERYKLIYFPESDSAELYDLQVDPKEKINLAGQGAEAEATLRVEMKNWLDSCANQAKELSTDKKLEQVIFDDDMKQRLRTLGYLQ